MHAVADFPTIIGSDCVVGHIAHLEGCVVHDRSLIGSGSVVLHEVVIGSGSTVAAGAVVRNRTHVPANSLVVGVPGQVRPDASSEETIVANAAQYVANAALYRRELRVL